jgi:hypothetical protein
LNGAINKGHSHEDGLKRTWIDVKKAFGSVDHAYIQLYIQLVGYGRRLWTKHVPGIYLSRDSQRWRCNSALWSLMLYGLFLSGDRRTLLVPPRASSRLLALFSKSVGEVAVLSLLEKNVRVCSHPGAAWIPRSASELCCMPPLATTTSLASCRRLHGFFWTFVSVSVACSGSL